MKDSGKPGLKPGLGKGVSPAKPSVSGSSSQNKDRDIEKQLRGVIESDEELLQFQQIREYIRSHPGSTVEDVAYALEIEERVILRYLREGRLLKR